MTDRNIPTDLVSKLQEADAHDNPVFANLFMREAANMLGRARSIISIREAGMPSAKGAAWLAQLEGREPYG